MLIIASCSGEKTFSNVPDFQTTFINVVWIQLRHSHEVKNTLHDPEIISFRVSESHRIPSLPSLFVNYDDNSSLLSLLSISNLKLTQLILRFPRLLLLLFHSRLLLLQPSQFHLHFCFPHH